MNSELYAWVFLNHVPELGPMRFHRLLKFAGSAEEILRLNVSGLRAAEVSDDLAARWIREFQNPENRRRADNEVARMERGEFRLVTEIDPSYPASLRELLDRPAVLYVKGRWPLSDQPAIALVGTRHPTPYGLAAAQWVTQGLVRRGIRIVSGLALGIDRIAHERTLREDGHTVGVLGHGFGFLYPKQNRDLYQSMAERGTLVTEFPYSVGPETFHFPRRNRIIAGLSRGVVVVEAGDKSGALITARNAAEQGRDVFAIPGSIFEALSAGCHRLLKEGAKLVERVEDILEEYEDLKDLPVHPRVPSADETVELSALEKEVLSKISEAPVSVDELAVWAQQPIDLLANALLSLELKGKIRPLPGQRYAHTFN